MIERCGRTSELIPVIGSDDVKNVDLTKIHNLSGPVAIEGAEPGDCLVVDILDGEPCTVAAIAAI